MKDKKTYLILCACLGWFGIHQFYIGNIGRGLLYMFTMGLMGFGWIGDLILANQIVDRYNASRGFMNTGVRNGSGR